MLSHIDRCISSSRLPTFQSTRHVSCLLRGILPLSGDINYLRHAILRWNITYSVGDMPIISGKLYILIHLNPGSKSVPPRYDAENRVNIAPLLGKRWASVADVNPAMWQRPAQVNTRGHFGISGPAPMAHLYQLGSVTWRYQVRIPVGPDICHRGCAYSLLKSVQMHEA